MLAINELESEDSVAAFVREFGLGFPVLLDRDGAVAGKLRVLGLPTTFFIDRDGVVSVAKVGEMDRAYIASEIARMGVQIDMKTVSLPPTTQDAIAPELPPTLAVTPSTIPQNKLNLDEFFPPGEGHDLVVETCLNCHEILTFGLARKSRDGWMRSRAYHANRFPSLSETQIESMYEYLVAKLNPDFPLSQQLPLGYSCGT